MDTTVFLAMLAAALCHAGWNALLKLEVEPFIAIALISVGCGVVVVPTLPFVGLPHPSSWVYVGASLAMHLVYYIALSEAYRHGDLGQAYPIARGSAPLLTGFVSVTLLGERLGIVATLGIALLASGILLLSVAGGRVRGHIEWRTVGFALLTATTISAYTLIDGTGARLSGSVSAYLAWLLLLDGLMMLGLGISRRGRVFVGALGKAWHLIVLGGAMSSASYGIAVWAMTVAPITLVAALRETSVLFAVLIGIVVLREPARPVRLAAVALAFAGVVLLRIGH